MSGYHREGGLGSLQVTDPPADTFHTWPQHPAFLSCSTEHRNTLWQHLPWLTQLQLRACMHCDWRHVLCPDLADSLAGTCLWYVSFTLRGAKNWCSHTVYEQYRLGVNCGLHVSFAAKHVTVQELFRWWHQILVTSGCKSQVQKEGSLDTDSTETSRRGRSSRVCESTALPWAEA